MIRGAACPHKAAVENWRNMTRTALDDAYANAAHIAGSAAFPARWAAEAAAFRADAHAELDIPYASDPGAGLDLFFPA
ncbi:MAG: hypothetical protein AAFQ50_07100, partial [Pseudomonadota bacterium]